MEKVCHIIFSFHLSIVHTYDFILEKKRVVVSKMKESI